MSRDLEDHVDPLAGRVPLRIRRALPPVPDAGAGAYEVRLELSRPLTEHERAVMHRVARGLLTAGVVLVVPDTTLDRVAHKAPALSRTVLRIEDEGRRRELEARERRRVLGPSGGAERRRLATLADRIRFPDPHDGVDPDGSNAAPTHPATAGEVVAALEQRLRTRPADGSGG